MTTIFQRIDAAVSAEVVDANLAGQIGKITAIAETLRSLINVPPDEIGDIITTLGDLPIPDLTVGDGIGEAFDQIRGLLPDSAIDLTTDIEAKIGVAGDLVADVKGTLDDALRAALALHRLTEIDWACSHLSPEADAGGDAGDGGGDGGIGSGDASDDSGGVSVSATNQVVAETNATLDLFPDPFTIESIVETVAALSARDPEAPQRFFMIPVLDELADSLNTVVAWRNMSAAELQVSLNAALSSLASLLREIPDELLVPLSDVAAELNAGLPFSEIDGILEQLANTYDELASAVDSGDLSTVGATVAAADAALTQLEGLAATLSAPDLKDSLTDGKRRIDDLPADLPDAVERHVSRLEAPPEVEGLTRILDRLQATIEEKLPTFRDDLQVDRLLEQIEDLVAALDFTAIQDPISESATALGSALNEVDQAIANLGVRLQRTIGEIDDVITAIDPARLLADSIASIDGYRTALSDELTTRFATARSAIESAVAGLDGTVGDFDPNDIIAPIQSVLDDVAGVLGDGEVVALIERIRASLDDIATQFDNLRFTPLTDEVIGGIEEIGVMLREITSGDIPDAAKAALQTGLAALPDSITPLTDPLLRELDELIDAGPVRLLESVKEQPARAMDSVRRFEPGRLVGEHLSPHFESVVEEVDAFRPSQLLQGVEAEFGAAKNQLATRIDPAKALAPLQSSFDDVDALFRELDPDRLIAPLNEIIASATSGVVDVLPAEEFFEQFDAVIGRVTAIRDAVSGVRDLLERIITMLDVLNEPESALNAMLDPIVATLAEITDAGFLQTGVDAVAAAADALRAMPLRDRIVAIIDPLEASLSDLDASAQFAALVQKHRLFPNDTLNALPPTAEKTAIESLLDRMDPMASGFADPLTPVIDLQECVAALSSRLDALFDDWDMTYHVGDAALGELGSLDGRPGTIAALLIDDTLQNQYVKPVAAILELLMPIRLSVDVLAIHISDLLDSIEARITALTDGPASLTSIRDNLGGIVDRFENLSLDIVSDALRAPIESLRSSVRALDPMSLAVPLRESLNAALDDLDFELLVPTSELRSLDDSFEAVVATLRGLDPERVVSEALRPTFDATVRPLIEALDVSDLLIRIAERLDTLADELEVELDRVDEAYKQLQQSAGAVGGSVSVTL